MFLCFSGNFCHGIHQEVSFTSSGEIDLWKNDLFAVLCTRSGLVARCDSIYPTKNMKVDDTIPKKDQALRSAVIALKDITNDSIFRYVY